MRGLRRDIIVIEELIKIKFPNVHMHMKYVIYSHIILF